MAAGAEGEAGVEAQADGGGVGRVVPGGGDPQAVGDFDGVELRLGEAHPVLFGHVFAAVFGNGDAEGCGSGGETGGRVGIFGKQGDDFAVLPNLFGAHAGFAEQGLFFVGAGVGVFDGGAECAVRHQGVGEFFGGAFVYGEGDLPVGHGWLSEYRVGGIRRLTESGKTVFGFTETAFSDGLMCLFVNRFKNRPTKSAWRRGRQGRRFRCAARGGRG